MNKDTASQYLPLVQALAEGKVIQHQDFDGSWQDLDEDILFVDPPELYQIKPAWIPQFKVGDRIRIIQAQHGAFGANDCVGTVTDDPSTNGLNSSEEGYHVKLENGRVWAIGTKAKVELAPLSPLPTPKKLIPLEASDVPPGSAIRLDENGWGIIQSASKFGVVVTYPGGGLVQHFVEYRALAEMGWQILRPNHTEFVPCSKEVDA